MDFDVVCTAFRDAIDREDFPLARQQVDAAEKQFADDIRTYELLDCWYYLQSSLPREERLRGRLLAIDKMLHLNPEDDEEAHAEADYESGLYFERARILTQLAEVLEDALLLKQAMDAFDKYIEVRGLDSWVAGERLASFQMISQDLPAEVIQEVFGDISIRLLEYMDAAIATDSEDSEDTWKEKGNYLLELGRPQEAVAAFRSAVAIDNNDFSRIALIQCYLQIEEFEAALRECKIIPDTNHYASKKLLLEARALARLCRLPESLHALKLYQLETRGIGEQAAARSHRDFIELWDDPTFLAMTEGTYDHEQVEAKRAEIRNQLPQVS